jgi:hypothetical protein
MRLLGIVDYFHNVAHCIVGKTTTSPSQLHC